MELKIIWLLTLVSYSFIVSQSLMYIIALRNVQLNMDAPSYTSFRKLLDKNFRNKFRFPFYSTFITNSVLVTLCSTKPFSLGFITSVVGWVAFAENTLFMLKGNLPVNKAINDWTPDTVPPDWVSYRDLWLSVFMKRQVCDIVGFLSLLIGVVFG